MVEIKLTLEDDQLKCVWNDKIGVWECVITDLVTGKLQCFTAKHSDLKSAVIIAIDPEGGKKEPPEIWQQAENIMEILDDELRFIP